MSAHEVLGLGNHIVIIVRVINSSDVFLYSAASHLHRDTLSWLHVELLNGL